MPGSAARTLANVPTLLQPREVPLGGPRAMTVRRTLPHRELRTVGAWCFADDYGPDRTRMVLPPHPHTELQTVSWLLEGDLVHQDSVGSEQLVQPGGLSLMTAGRGIAHAETSTVSADVLRGLQLWVALPFASRRVAPHYEHHAELPTYVAPGVVATVFLGSLGDVRSPATAYSPIVGADAVLSGAAVLPLNPSWEYAVLALEPGLAVDGVELPVAALRYFPPGRSELPVGGTSRAVLLGGQPFGEELVMWWNFVGRSHEDIAAARADWDAAMTGETTRFGAVPYELPWIPAPPLPAVRLRPRGADRRLSAPRPPERR